MLNVSPSIHNIRDNLSNHGIDWQSIPLASPYWGDIWESGVKMVKHRLKRMIGNSQLTYEELNALWNQIESILNSRLLCSLNSDSDQLQILTKLTSTPTSIACLPGSKSQR